MTPGHSRAAAALGALTALAGVLLVAGGAPAPLSAWLALTGLVVGT